MTQNHLGISGAMSQRRRGEKACEIAQVLRGEIIAGAYPDDTVMRQQHLAERFGVSRMPVREALRHLEAEGFVSLKPNCGARVLPLSVADLQEVYEMRIAAETLALRLALPELSNAQLDRAEAIQDRLEKAGVAEFGALNIEFHTALYLPCSRPRLLSHIKVLGNAADRYLRITITSLDYAQKSHGEHHALLRACRQRDEHAAVSCLAGHIEKAGKALVALMKQRQAQNQY